MKQGYFTDDDLDADMIVAARVYAVFLWVITIALVFLGIVAFTHSIVCFRISHLLQGALSIMIGFICFSTSAVTAVFGKMLFFE